MTTLRTYKFMVMPVLQQVADDGTVTGEVQPQQPDQLFGTEALARYAAGFDAAVAAQNNAPQNGGMAEMPPPPIVEVQQ